MARSPAVSVLQRKEKSQQLQFRLSQQVVESLNQVEERIKEETTDMEFNRNQVVEVALLRAVREANDALDELKKKGASAS